MKTRAIVFLLISFLLTSALGAQNVVSPLYSPYYSAGGAGTGSLQAPFSDRFNPALPAGSQRMTFDASYFGLPGFQTSGYGNAFNLGLTVPTRYGVFTGTGSYLGASFTNFNLGNLGQFGLGFAKDVFDDLYVGTSIGTTVGDQGWGLGLSVGMYQIIGDLGLVKDFQWGIAMRDMGKAYTTPSQASVPPSFTPALGAEFSVWKTKDFNWTFRPDVSFPSVQDVNFSVGTKVAIQDFLVFDVAYTFDLRDTLNKNAPSIPIQGGIAFKFKTDIKDQIDLLNFSQQGWNRSEVNVSTAAVPLPGGVWGFGGGINVPLGVLDKNPPEIKTEATTSYISPNNDGVQDSYDLPLNLTDERYITSYSIQIVDGTGKTVRTIQNKIVMPESGTFDSFWKRLTYAKKGIDIPPFVTWNGFTDAGNVAPDGTYKITVTASDDNRNQKTVDAGTVVVKNIPPKANAEASFTEFNPTGPRNKLPVVQSGSVEDQWVGTFKNAQGSVVRTYTWKTAAPAAFEWDGKEEDGKIVPDGVYSYELQATDRAGNKATAKVGNLLINSLPTPLDLTLNRSAFSPEGNGVKTLVLQPKPGLPTGIVHWKVQILDNQGTVKRTLEGNSGVPSEITFDGKDQANQGLKEGEYRAQLTLDYSNGNQPQVTTNPFTIRNTPPKAEVTSPYTVFSPGSDDGRGVITLEQKTSAEESWTGKIEDSNGKVIRSVRWPEKADATYLWDGRGSDGQILPDGTYTYVVESTDKAGNVGKSVPLKLTIDTQKRSVLLSSDRSAFSPVASGANSKVKLLPQIKIADGLVEWDLAVEDATGKTVRQWKNQTKVVPSVEWDGKDDQGKTLGDGIYTAVLKTNYQNGSTPSARSNAIRVKSQLPTISIKADQTVFSTTPDSTKKSISISQQSSTENEWQGRILKGDQVVRSWSWKGETPDVNWDATDSNGNKVADGTYRYEVQTVDEAGNKASAQIASIVVDSRPTAVFLTVGSDGFSPNGDSIVDTISFTTRLGVTDGIAQWKLEMVSDAGVAKRTFTGTGAVPAQIVWDGLTDVKTKADDGRYNAVLKVQYEKGNAPETKSTSFILQANAPVTAVDLSPIPFSPDNDGTADELGIALGVKDYAPIDSWSLDIFDPENHRFTSFNGKGSPSAKLTWDGRSDTGELVQSASDYTLVFQVKDTLGNAASIKKTLPIDVLVFKDGDRLRIIIPSITFAADSPDFLSVEPEKVEKNIKVLKRLGEIFTKYSKYAIVIEGHALMVNWNDPVRGKREQETELIPLSKSRAEAVKKFLVSEGIAASRISTEGVGGARPVVPFTDVDNRWKNRRVEFLLVRN